MAEETGIEAIFFILAVYRPTFPHSGCRRFRPDLAPTLVGERWSVRRHRPDAVHRWYPAPAKRTLFWRYKRARNIRKAVRHGDLKYVDDNGAKGLYNIEADPHEKDDLLKSHPSFARDLEERLGRWEKDVESPRLKGFRAPG